MHARRIPGEQRDLFFMETGSRGAHVRAGLFPPPGVGCGDRLSLEFFTERWCCGMEKLSVKQKRFCDEYLIDLNATQAAIRAGYKEKYAHTNAPKLLQNTTIKEYIDKRMAEKEDQLIAKQNEVLKYLTAVMRRELMEYVVVTVSEEHSYYAPDEDGKMRKRTDKTETPKVVPIPARLSDSNKGAELLGKRYRLFTDSVDMNGAIPVVITGEDELED